ncbi:MAG: tRNA (N(6)-L-threonylcarbamoyladenosine(37)-C(2))-methylthiotransferase MtaB [Pirellulales bacterium]|nr:tRNA (N(6)-L-threonylcarbamoyladenosine(37)-C(2))-methylthiotransferase MtaB [Pirellulales bacterium]
MTFRTIKTVTLGCRVNQYETEFLRQGFQRLGYRDAVDGEPVDLCIVNGCVVTAESEAKTRKAIRRMAKAHPRAEIIVVGCYAARAGEEAAAMPGVVEVVADKRQMADLLARRGLTDAPTGIERFPSRRRAYVKVQDGCLAGCSYCIVPKVRPYMTSRPTDEILGEVRRLVENGHREVVLTGVHLGAFPSLAGLVRRITDLPGEFRVRLSSIEAAEVTPELISLMVERRERICPFLHLSLQSGSDAVLRRMNRRWTAGRFVSRCREIHSALDRPAICTDAIVGFPGETEADFEATCRAIEEAGIAKIHVFRFSPRPGTAAAEMPDQIVNNVIDRRAGILRDMGNLARRKFCRTLIGRQLHVIVESTLSGRPGWVAGTSEHHIPVIFLGDEGLIGKLVAVAADSEEDGRIVARNISDIPK